MSLQRCERAVAISLTLIILSLLLLKCLSKKKITVRKDWSSLPLSALVPFVCVCVCAYDKRAIFCLLYGCYFFHFIPVLSFCISSHIFKRLSSEE